MGNKPGRGSGRAGGPAVTVVASDAPVANIALEAAQQRLTLAKLTHSRLGHCGTAADEGASSLSGAALLPRQTALHAALAQRVVEAWPPVFSGRYEGTWVVVGPEDGGSASSAAAEVTSLAGRTVLPPPDERQYCYGLAMDAEAFEIRRDGPRDVASITGAIEWRLLRAPPSAPLNLASRIGDAALEHVSGTISPSGQLELTGHTSSDPKLIGTDSYRLRLVRVTVATGAGTIELRGASKGLRGNWDAQLRLKKVAALAQQDADGFFTSLS